MRAGPALTPVLGLLLGLGFGPTLAACSDDPPDAGGPSSGATSRSATGSPSPGPTDGSGPAGSGTPSANADRAPRVVGTVATGLRAPWGVAFLPDGDAIVTERDSRRVLRVHRSGGGSGFRVQQVGTVGAAAPQGEAGLLGVAASPDFASDHRLFLYVSTPTDNRILRTTLHRGPGGGRLGPTSVVLDGIPNGFIHDGGRLAFGPDGYLYASTGETGDGPLAQDLGSLGGKILRITQDGDPAPGNPLDGSPVWSYGHRNVQGLAFDERDRLWASEFGADTWDELNLIEPGDNHGWPMVEGRGGTGDLVDPQLVWRTSVASPSGLAYLDGHLWMASLRGERLWRVDVTGARAQRPTDFFVGRYGRMRTVAVAPDGRLWVTTSNRDGRGDPSPGDDRILLVDPGGAAPPG